MWCMTEKIEEDPAARIQRPALKKKTQLHRGALKMIIQSQTSSRQKIYSSFIQESNRKRTNVDCVPGQCHRYAHLRLFSLVDTLVHY